MTTFDYLLSLILPYLPMIGISLFKIITIVLLVAYLVYFERKIIGFIQLRQGPNTVGPFGLLQPIADGLKALHKEIIIPSQSRKTIFLLAPVLTFTVSIAAWAAIPVGFGKALADINVGILYIFAMSSLNVYGIILAGWASNSKYAFLGALRSAAQMISYEVSIGLIIMGILISAGSMNLYDIVIAQKNIWYIIPHFPMFVVFVISALAETNRTPFDLPEAEAELAGGYNVEYSSFPFALFMLGEYANVILMSALTTILFLGGWHPILGFSSWTWIHPFVWFTLKTSCIVFVFIWVRGTLPRYRYDQLMRLGWKIFLPLSLFWVIFVSFVTMLLKWAPKYV